MFGFTGIGRGAGGACHAPGVPDAGTSCEYVCSGCHDTRAVSHVDACVGRYAVTNAHAYLESSAGIADAGSGGRIYAHALRF